MSIPTFMSERLILRPLRATDAADMFAYAQDEQVARPGMWEPYASFEECERHVQQLVGLYERDLMWWALEHRADGKVIGRVELSDWSRDNERANLSYALAQEYWGQGLMTEAALIAMDYGWKELKLHRLGATVLPDNEASIKLLGKLGFEFEGRLRHHRKHWGEWVDVDVYGMLAP
ncbi:MAG: GNAT family N-acetyltransferase [Armatimonadetes bacterium]|nr:GNAT family N-acetyltransferase [Armatimonadota bacterium]